MNKLNLNAPLFITGTDTDVGKTVVSAALLNGLKQLNHPAVYWKPIQAGLETPDTEFICTHGGETHDSALSLKLPASPDQALEAEAKAGLTALEISTMTPECNGPLIVEGAGGVLVPINQFGETWLDVLKLWRYPIFVVARTGLGTLNHTLLTVHRLLDTGLDVKGVIMSGEHHPGNEGSLAKFLPSTPLFNFPVQDDPRRPRPSDCRALADFCIDCLSSVQPRDSDWLKMDAAHVWHPYTQHKLVTDTLGLVGALGSHVITAQGKRLIDASSSWWVNTIGHGREEIRAAISRQQASMDHVIFAGATHQPGSRLAKRLVDLSQGRLNKVFYSDNGSTAVEVGIKMALQAHQLAGNKSRTKYLSLNASYHGDTIGTMTLGGTEGFHQYFKPLMFPTTHLNPVTSHPSSVCPEGPAAREQYLDELRQHLNQHHNDYAALVIEPLLQGAGGMLIQDRVWLRQLVEMCRSFGIFIVLDEVFTGLGRLGSAFAFHLAAIDPDIVCLAKGLTGGTMPLSVTMATDEIFERFLSDSRSQAFLHGHSYTGNPIACAAALATLDIFEAEDLPAKARNLEQHFRTWIGEQASKLPIQNPRAIGGVLAMELQSASGHGDYFDERALKIPKIAERHGLFLRPLGNTVYLVLPLTISSGDLDDTLSGLTRTINELCI